METPRRDRRLLRPIRADADRLAVDRAIVAVPQPFRLALTILRETGMRADEVLALTIGDVVLDAGHEALHVRDAKNRSEPYGRAWRGCDTQELARAASYTPRTEERAAPRSALIEAHV